MSLDRARSVVLGKYVSLSCQLPHRRDDATVGPMSVYSAPESVVLTSSDHPVDSGALIFKLHEGIYTVEVYTLRCFYTLAWNREEGRADI